MRDLEALGQRHLLASRARERDAASIRASIRARRSSRCRNGAARSQLAYHHDLTDDLALIARAESNYVGSRTDETYATNTLPSYDLTNIRGGFQGERWSAVLFVNNVADKRALLNNITQDAENLADFNRVAVSQPRTAGIDLNYKFK